MKKILALVLALVLCASMVCVASAETALEKVLAAGKLVVGTEATYPPYEYLDDNANFAGFVVDYAVGMSMVNSSDGALEVANFEFSAEEASFGKACVLAKGSDDLLAKVNEVIAKVTSDGSYQAAYDAAVAATGETGE